VVHDLVGYGFKTAGIVLIVLPSPRLEMTAEERSRRDGELSKKREEW